MRRLLMLVLVAGCAVAVAPTMATAQSNLPPCTSNQYVRWDNCFGTITFPDGAKYVGEWRDNKKSGHGTYTWANGEKYVGEFRDDERHGQGTYTLPSGEKYVGEFRDGVRTGYGKEFAPNGSKIREGYYLAGVYFGPTAPPGYKPPGFRVSLVKKGGVYTVPVLINNTLPLHFVVDSGAADVSIPGDVVLTLMRTGTLTSKDFIGSQKYRLADGSTVESKTFIIRLLKVGNRTINNVRGSIADVNGSLLLGQSFLENFKSWSMDNNRHELVLE